MTSYVTINSDMRVSSSVNVTGGGTGGVFYRGTWGQWSDGNNTSTNVTVGGNGVSVTNNVNANVEVNGQAVTTTGGGVFYNGKWYPTSSDGSNTSTSVTVDGCGVSVTNTMSTGSQVNGVEMTTTGGATGHSDKIAGLQSEWRQLANELGIKENAEIPTTVLKLKKGIKVFKAALAPRPPPPPAAAAASAIAIATVIARYDQDTSTENTFSNRSFA